jgi:hypothetical protein
MRPTIALPAVPPSHMVPHLDGCSHGHDLIRVDTSARLLVKYALHNLVNLSQHNTAQHVSPAPHHSHTHTPVRDAHTPRGSRRKAPWLPRAQGVTGRECERICHAHSPSSTICRRVSSSTVCRRVSSPAMRRRVETTQRCAPSPSLLTAVLAAAECITPQLQHSQH